MKRVAAVIFFVGALTHEAWSKPRDNNASNQRRINDLGTNVGGRLGSALGQTVGAGLDGVQQLGAGVLGLGAGLVGGVGSGLGLGLQAGLNPGQSEGGRVSVDLGAGANGYNDGGSYPYRFPITTNNAGNVGGPVVELGYRPSAEYGYDANYGGFNGVGISQRIQYPTTNVYPDHVYPNSYPYNPHSASYGGNYFPDAGHRYQSLVPHVYHSPYPYNTPDNMNDLRIGVSYAPGYRPAEYVYGGNYGPGQHYPAANDKGYQYVGAPAYPDHIYPQYSPVNTHVRLDGGYVNGGGFDSGARTRKLHNAEANINNNRASYPNGYSVNSNNAGPRTAFDNNYDARVEYGDDMGTRGGNGLGIRGDKGFASEAGARSDVAPVSRRRPEPGYDNSNEGAYDARNVAGPIAPRLPGASVGIGAGPSGDKRLESEDGVYATVGNSVRPIVENGAEFNVRPGVEGGVGQETRPSVPSGTESNTRATVDNEAGIRTDWDQSRITSRI